jgi:hypothetical protein
MKKRIPSVFGIMAAVFLVASFVVPGSLTGSAVDAAQPTGGECVWQNLEMPGSVLGKTDIYNASEINTLSVGPDNSTLLATVTRTPAVPAAGGHLQLRKGSSMGIFWGGSQGARLRNDMAADGVIAGTQNVWDAIIAPDDANFWVVVTSSPPAAGGDAPTNVWITENGGATWQNTQFNVAAANSPSYQTGTIGAVAISPTYSGGKRDIAVGIRDCGDLNCGCYSPPASVAGNCRQLIRKPRPPHWVWLTLLWVYSR